MPYQVRDVPSVTFSSGATASPSVHLIDDAEVLGLICTTATSPLTVEVAHSTSTGASFVPLLAGSLGLSPVLLGSSGTARMVFPVGFVQMRFSSTAVVNTATVVTIQKQIPV